HNREGTPPTPTGGGTYDVIIAGSGMSGLAAAFYLTRRRPGTRILILDVNATFGGNAGRDDAAPLPVPPAPRRSRCPRRREEPTRSRRTPTSCSRSTARAASIGPPTTSPIPSTATS